MNPEHTVVFVVAADLNAQPADVERWAAHRGYIIANPRKADHGDIIIYQGKTITATPHTEIWIADIIVADHDQEHL